jgi:UDP-N-acetylglucosamine transferase subunit ALG13
MIFVTVGTQLPFDRMIHAIDHWAGRIGRRDVFAQIGPSLYRPRHIEWKHFLNAEACREKTRAASLVVAHAGMGTIITALEMGKPVLVMPRRMALGEQRNDHQLATVEQLLRQGKVSAALDADELIEKLDRLDLLHAGNPISTSAGPELLTALRRFIDGPMEINLSDPESVLDAGGALADLNDRAG